MAIKVSEIRKQSNQIKLISVADDSIKWFDEDNPKYIDGEGGKEPDGTTADKWLEYTETLNESHITFKDNEIPTRFVCNFDLTDKHMRKIKNHMLGGRDEDGRPGLNYGDWSAEVTRRTLKGIEEPEGLAAADSLKFKLDKDNLVHHEVMSVLQKVGVVEEIFKQFSRLVLNGVKSNAKN